MLPHNNPDRIRIVFDDHRLVANAGLLLRPPSQPDARRMARRVRLYPVQLWLLLRLARRSRHRWN